MSEKPDAKDNLKTAVSQPDSFSQGLTNELAVAAMASDKIGRQIQAELNGGWKKDLAIFVGESAAALPAGYLLSQSPLCAAAVSTWWLSNAAISACLSGTAALANAWGANTDAQREKAAKAEANLVGREAKVYLPAIPAWGVGKIAGRLASGSFAKHEWALAIGEDVSGSLLGKSSIAKEIAGAPYAVKDHVEFRARDLFTSNESCWRPKVVESLPRECKDAEGRLNIIAINKWLNSRHAWKGVEEGRHIRISDMKASRAFAGAPHSNLVPGIPTDEPHIFFHSHPPCVGSSSKWAEGSLPSYADMRACSELSVIQSGSRTTIFAGKRHMPELFEAKAEDIPVEAIVFDPKNKLAVQLDRTYFDRSRKNMFSEKNPRGGYVRMLDYNEAEKVLQAWDGKWDSLNSICTRENPFRHEDFIA